jgi:ribosome-binding ATPase YchF (GTP1/OBG family)
MNYLDWLNLEMHSWIFNNLWSRWDSIKRRHVACKNTIVETLSSQLSGYGCSRKFIIYLCDKLGYNSTFDQKPASTDSTVIKSKLQTWDEAMVREFVWKFLEERFPTIYALNKIDMKSSSKNIEKLFNRYDQDRIVLTSALSECFLRKLAKTNFIAYNEGDGDFTTYEEAIDQNNDDLSKILKSIDKQNQKDMLENVRDFVLFRYGSTGVFEAVSKAVELQSHVAVYPVPFNIPALKQLHDISTANDIHVTAELQRGMFQDVWLAKEGTSIRHVVHRVYRAVFEKARQQAEENNNSNGKKDAGVKWFCEGEDGRKLSDTEPITGSCTLLRVVFT